MNILILGATGRTGKHILDEALKNGHKVHVLVRDKSKLHPNIKGLTVFEGVATDKDQLAKAMKGCDSVVSALNISRNSDFPWSKLRTPKDFLSQSMANIVALAKEQGIKRIAVCSAHGVFETKQQIPWWFRFLINNSNIGVAYKDHELQEEVLKSSNLNWTIVRPVGLTNSVKEKEILVSLGNNPKPTFTIGRLNTAKFLLRTLEDNIYNKLTPSISEKKC